MGFRQNMYTKNYEINGKHISSNRDVNYNYNTGDVNSKNYTANINGSGYTETVNNDIYTEKVNGKNHTEDSQKQQNPPMIIVWRNVILFTILHTLAFYAFFLLPYAKWETIISKFVFGFLGGFGITAGAHRLWSHKSYKARLPLRIFLTFCNTVASQDSIIEWSRNHRVHHRFSETDADPHNAKRGLFFSHMGWLLVRKHPDVIRKGRTVDMSDLHADSVCAFQHRYYTPLVLFCCFTLPSAVPYFLWNESLWISFVLTLWRYTITLHITWTVNSLAHFYGNRPYDNKIRPAENILVCTLAIGEGFHNYHHTFPYDYSTSEFGWKINITTAFLDFMALIGQVYGRRKVSPKLIMQKMQKAGDGTSGFDIF